MKLCLTILFYLIFNLGALGNITFDFVTSRNLFTSSFSVAVGDINNDGLQDIVTSIYFENEDQMKILVYLQNVNNLIIDSPIVYHFLNNGNAISDISIADLNNDGLNDIVVGRLGNGSNSLGIFFQNANTNLLNPVVFWTTLIILLK